MALIDRTITTYTFLDTLSELGVKQLDLYVPLVCKSIIKHDAKEVSREVLKSWFANDYGMSTVYQGVFDTLMKKMNGKYLVWQNGKYIVDLAEVTTLLNRYQEHDISKDIDALLHTIKEFAKAQYNLEFSLDSIQEGVLDFLHTRDGDFLFQQGKMIDVLSRQQVGKIPDKRRKYVISQFIIWSKDNQIESFKLFAKMAKGHVLTSIVTLKDVESYTGKMKGVTIALDTPIIFNLLGLNYKNNFELEEELLRVLLKQGAEFVLFQEHYQEIKQSISSAIHLLYTRNYNLNKANRLLQYAVKNHVSTNTLRLKLQQLETMLEHRHIVVRSAPESETGYSEMDIGKFENLLKMRYSNGRPDELDDNIRKIIATDADVVSYIYRLRGHNVATNLKNCKALLVTTNTAVAYASKHPDLSDINHIIPVCLTDVFLSTTLWFNYPDVDADVNEKVLISECYKNITLADDILQRFYRDVERLNEESPLTEEQILLANTSDLVMDMLENKTFNDENLYTDMTASEILEEIDRQRNKQILKHEEYNGRIKRNLHKFSRCLATALFFIIWLLLVVLFLILRFVDYSSWYGWNILFNSLTFLPVIWGLLSWGGFLPSKVDIIGWMSKHIYSFAISHIEK